MTNEELQQLVEKQGKEIIELTNRLNALDNNATIPLQTGEAIKARVLTDAGVALLSTKSASSESESINEAGIASHSVLPLPDGYLEVTLSGVIRYVPFYL